MKKNLAENIVLGNPIEQFNLWFEEATLFNIPFANAMTLATATKSGKPSARIVLLKGVDDRGFIFFTNYKSRKGIELSSNPKAALLFHWPALERQVRIEGKVGKVSSEESDSYFQSRPRESQISAVVSRQSEVVPDRDALEVSWNKLAKQLGDLPVPRPKHWGGYYLTPKKIEFWQSRESRLHDRILYELQKNNAWNIRRLAP